MTATAILFFALFFTGWGIISTINEIFRLISQIALNSSKIVTNLRFTFFLFSAAALFWAILYYLIR